MLLVVCVIMCMQGVESLPIAPAPFGVAPDEPCGSVSHGNDDHTGDQPSSLPKLTRCCGEASSEQETPQYPR